MADQGVWVKVHPDDAGGVPGLGGWTKLVSVSGTYTQPRYEFADSEGVEWVAYEFTDDGSVTIDDTDGDLADVLTVSAACVSVTRTDQGGHGGGVFRGIEHLDGAGPHQIVIGESGQYGSSGGPTIFNGMGPTGGLWGDNAWAGNGGSPYTSTGLGGFTPYPGVGVMDDILGPSDIRGYGGGGNGDSVYGGGNPPRANSGAGRIPGNAAPGASGVCIIRVPKQFADQVTETFHGWDKFVLVDSGVVTDLVKVPDNEPHTLESEWVSAPSEVQLGWNYIDGEFVSPVTEEEEA